jgi:hypothetical protein
MEKRMQLPPVARELLPITTEVSRLTGSNPLQALAALRRFVFRIVRERRGNELLFNALREIRYAMAGPCDIGQSMLLTPDNVDEMNRHLAPQLAAMGYELFQEFSSNEEDKCIVLEDWLISKTSRELRFYDMKRNLVRSIEVNGFLSNFVALAGRVYFVAGGTLYSVTALSEVRNENLQFSTKESTVLDQGIARDNDGNLVVAEYKLDTSGVSGALLYLLRAGDTHWTTIDTLARQVDKHCHIVFFDPSSQFFYVTCGDNRKILATLDLKGQEPTIRIVSDSAGRTGGYLSAVPWEGGFLCGTDYTGGTNFLVFIRGDRIVRKEVLHKPFRRSVVSSMAAARGGLLFAAWNKGYLPECCNGLLLRSPAGVRSLCHNADSQVAFKLFASPDGLVVRAEAHGRRVFGIYRRADRQFEEDSPGSMRDA